MRSGDEIDRENQRFGPGEEERERDRESENFGRREKGRKKESANEWGREGKIGEQPGLREREAQNRERRERAAGAKVREEAKEGRGEVLRGR